MEPERKELHAYDSELKDSMERIAKCMPRHKESRYFLQQAYHFFPVQKIREKEPDVIIYGTNFPEEILYALKVRPFWLRGGSFATAVWADSNVPRDTDSVSKSALGYLSNEFFDLTKKAFIVIPLVSDSSRKQAHMLNMAGKRVCTVSLPAVENENSEKEWIRQLERCTAVLEKHIHRRLTGRSLKRAESLVPEAKKQARIFINLCEKKPGVISGIARMFILDSYYFTENIEEWAKHLENLNRWLAACKQPETAKKSSVLLAGSPVAFPNYKIPFLLQDVGMEIAGHIDGGVCHLVAQEYGREGKQGFFMPGNEYGKGCFGAGIKNEALYHAAKACISRQQIDGVVYHVIKGQIEYDFELERMEELFGKYGIPVFRLETDYNRQDIEQLRIRMEAFAEVLEQKKYRKERMG